MNGAEITSLVLGTIGTVTGIYAAWLSHKAIRQELILSRTDDHLLRFRVTNLSLRPIPVLSITLELKNAGKFTPSSESPKLEGILTPGVLSPESCFNVQWASTRQIVDALVHEEFLLSVTTQTGKTFRLQGATTKRSQQSTPPYFSPAGSESGEA